MPAWWKAFIYWEQNNVHIISLSTGIMATFVLVLFLSLRWKSKTRASAKSTLKHLCGTCGSAFFRLALATGLICGSIGFALLPTAINSTIELKPYRDFWCDQAAQKTAYSRIHAAVLNDAKFMNTARTSAVASSKRFLPDPEDCYIRDAEPNTTTGMDPDGF